MYQERAQACVGAGQEEARLEALHKWIQAAEQSGDQVALAQAHMQMGLAHQQQVQNLLHHLKDMVILNTRALH